MDKFLKRILGAAAIGALIAGVVYYFKQNHVSDDDFEDDFEDEDFDLDNDLKPVGDREYVSLSPKNAEEEVSEEAKTATEKSASDDTSDEAEKEESAE